MKCAFCYTAWDGEIVAGVGPVCICGSDDFMSDRSFGILKGAWDDLAAMTVSREGYRADAYKALALHDKVKADLAACQERCKALEEEHKRLNAESVAYRDITLALRHLARTRLNKLKKAKDHIKRHKAALAAKE